ncbi:hypothetical protein WJ74_17920 [Burkholderia ubonensis]|uniref:hypothetical protein n=1 Tax=Burkholderia ubonensis TaxID=101571 RepID=UPI00075C1725|nr:hypothetical protein [Burkholderia ubonensis]KVO33362.1 hypothetical protein WJ74_17920 [Burkholderia ubonensis]
MLMKKRTGARRASEEDSGILNVSMPVIPDAFPDGLLPVPVANRDVTVKVAWWSGIQSLMILQLQWQRRGGTYVDVGASRSVTASEAADSNTVFDLVIPQFALMPEGEYLLRVRATSFFGGNVDYSDGTPLEVDRTAPGGTHLPPLVFPPNVDKSKTVTADDLVDDKLIATVADWHDEKPGDLLIPMIGGDEVAPMPPVEVIAPDFEVHFSRADLERAGDGLHDFTYTVTDRAGNKSLPARDVVTLKVVLRDAPTNLLAPRVPAADKGLIIFADTFPDPLEVHISSFPNVRNNDEIILYWGTRAVGTLRVTDATADPVVTFALDYGVLADVMPQGDIDVTYIVMRDRTIFGPSPVTPVTVNLTLPAGPDIDPISGVHRNLKPALTISAGGARNEIPVADFNRPATIEVDWFAVDGSPVYLQGDEIDIDWGAQTGAITYTVTPADVANPATLVLTLPADKIVAEGTGHIPVRYTVTRQLGGGHSNTSVAPTEIVLVRSMTDFPGGEDGLDEGTFPEARYLDPPFYGALGLTDIESGKGYYRVASYKNITDGDTIVVRFRGTGGPIPDGSGPDIPGSADQLAYTVVAADITRGYMDFTIPVANWMRICFGAIHITYEVTNGFGSANCPEHHIVADVKKPGADTCPIP